MARFNLDEAYLELIAESETSTNLFDTRSSRIARLADMSTLQQRVNILRADQDTHHHTPAESLYLTETSFFRDPEVFEVLRRTVLPQLIATRAASRTLRIWSAAASTGQEAFSLAILTKGFPKLAAWDVRIHATDISREAIDHARRGLFRPAEIRRGLTPELLGQHFHPHAHDWAIHPSLAALCHFQPADLCDLPTLPTFDLILLRNALLYLHEQDRTHVLTAVHRHLSPDGYLLLGIDEQAEDSTTLFHPEQIEGICFYRPNEALVPKP